MLTCRVNHWRLVAKQHGFCYNVSVRLVLPSEGEASGEVSELRSQLQGWPRQMSRLWLQSAGQATHAALP